jgi:hypothetical protein
MSEQMVICEKCAGAIKNRDDLVTAVSSTMERR